MKKLISVVLTLLLLSSAVALADVIDFSSMTDEELHEVLNSARNELAKREMVADGLEPFFVSNGVSVYFTGEREFFGSTGLIVRLGVLIVNESNQKVSVRVNDAVVAGWSFSAQNPSDVPAGSKSNAYFAFTTNGEFKDLSEITDLTGNFYIYVPDTQEKTEIGNLTIHFAE